MSSSIEHQLHQELLRKLGLALKVDTIEDRNIICAEVFNDITGDIDYQAQDALNAGSASIFFEVLSRFYEQKWDAAEALLFICRQLWGQPYIVPVYALLLHRWLLLGNRAAGSQERDKYVNVLIAGAKQLFDLDVSKATARFQAMYDSLLSVISEADSPNRATKSAPRLASSSRDTLIRLVAAYTPYYADPPKVKACLFGLPALSTQRADASTLHDYIVTETTAMLHGIPSVGGLLRYLAGLDPLLRCSTDWRATVGTVPLLRLQGTLYSLTVPGGPRYYPIEVRRKGVQALNHAFPTGSQSRGMVRLLFRLMHPSDWPMLIYLWLQSNAVWVRDKLIALCVTLWSLMAMLAARCMFWRHSRS